MLGDSLVAGPNVFGSFICGGTERKIGPFKSENNRQRFESCGDDDDNDNDDIDDQLDRGERC